MFVQSLFVRRHEYISICSLNFVFSFYWNAHWIDDGAHSTVWRTS